MGPRDSSTEVFLCLICYCPKLLARNRPGSGQLFFFQMAIPAGNPVVWIAVEA
jgi:hypothetical protein